MKGGSLDFERKEKKKRRNISVHVHWVHFFFIFFLSPEGKQSIQTADREDEDWKWEHQIVSLLIHEEVAEVWKNNANIARDTWALWRRVQT
jgi:hypothetical protein